MLKFAPRAAVEAQARAGCPMWMSRLLALRGAADEEAAQKFLHPSLSDVRDPFSLNGMEKAVALLRDIRDRRVKTVVYGDYDADGVCASAILFEALQKFGVPCGVYIPDRREEGYGLNAAAVEKLSAEYGAMVTVDCGITAQEEIARAKSRGMTVILTDHHRPPETLPPADAIINPMLSEDASPLCGAGVAWKMAAALCGNAAEWLDLCALATIADMVPLTGENRALAYFGLRALTDTRRPGLIALKSIAGVTGAVTGESAAFALAPRVNATGRMDTADAALKLLLTRDEFEAEALAARLDQLNAERKRAEQAVLAEAESQISAMDLTRARVIVVCGEHWNPGVIGLAAGRVAEKYGYPAVAFAREGDNLVGSARSAGEIDLFEALSAESDLFLRFGGHKQAAGLTLPIDKLEEFTARFSDAVAAQLGGRAPVPVCLYDGEMVLSDFTLDNIALIEQLEPFGVGNPAPRFLLRGLTALEMRPVGAEGKHLRVTFSQGGDMRSGVMFGGGEEAAPAGANYTVVAAPSRNEYRGRASAEMRVQALKIEPETLITDDFALLSAFLPDIGGAPATGIAALPPLRAQGDLLICRTGETLKKLLKALPGLDFVTNAARDMRAYSALALPLAASAIHAPYTRIFLCDGDFGEADALRQARPDAEVLALPRTAAALRLLADADPDTNELRRAYKACRAGAGALSVLARSAELSPEKTLAALHILSDAGLIACVLRPFSLSVPPPVKTDPEIGARCRLLHAVKEEFYGKHGV